jgi:hypothetical protein
MVEGGFIDNHFQNPTQAIWGNYMPRLEIPEVIMGSNGFPGVPKLHKKKKTNKYAHAYVLYIYNPYGLVGSTLVGEPCRLQ